MRAQRKILFLTLCPLFLLCVLCGLAFSDLQWPLKEKTYLTGTFGEFRRNHIHAGVDISTRGKTGLPVYAGESGILYRVKTQFLGFGKAVYIKLDDGRFLVYAHLDRFNPEIEKIVKEAQEKNGKYEVDVSSPCTQGLDTYPKEKITIQRGDPIGYSGDTGGVSPHLHIELRDPDERPLNPLNSLKLQDTTPPVITGLALCNPYTTKAYPIRDLSSPITISGETGLAISTHDHNLGVYKIDLIVDGELFFTVKMDIFSYDEFKDHFLVYNKDLYINKNRIYYHLFRAFDNKLPFYPLKPDGILNLSPGKHSLEIDVFDHPGNKSTLRFNIISKTPSPSPLRPTPRVGARGTHAKAWVVERACGARVRGTDTWLSSDKLCKVNILKEDQYYPIQVEIDTISPNVYNIKPKEAVFKKATISIAGNGHIYKYGDGKWKYMGKDTITVADLGKFGVFKDTTPPTIKIVSTYPVFRAKIDDNSSGLDYDKLSLCIDEEKVIAEYSVNRKELFYTMPKGKYKITCIATDKAGNANKITKYASAS